MQRTGQTLPCQAPSRPSYIPGRPSLNRRRNTRALLAYQGPLSTIMKVRRRHPQCHPRPGRASGLPLSAEQCPDHPAQSGVGRRHHLPAHGPGLPLPGGCHGLAQPVRGGLATVQYSGGGLLRIRLAGGVGERPTGGVQQPPGQPVHQRGVHPDAAGTLGEDHNMDGKGRYGDTFW